MLCLIVESIGWKFLREILYRRPVEVVTNRRPKEGENSLGCIICVEGLTESDIEQIKAVFQMRDKRTWVVRRMFAGRERRCLIVHFNLSRRLERVSYPHYLYEPAVEFADWLVHTLKEEFELSVSVNIRRTEDVRGCLA